MPTSFYHGFDTRHWNPLVGCDHGGRFGCMDKCWARGIVARFGGTWTERGDFAGFHPRLIEKWLNKPLHWRKPQRVATGFMGDIACLTPDDLLKVVEIMSATRRHTYLLLTKDPARLLTNLSVHYNRFPDNVWAGATVRNQEDADRVIPALLRVPAAHHWLSIEPCLGPIDLTRWLYGRHFFPPSDGTEDCHYDCGAWLGPYRGGGARGYEWDDPRFGQNAFCPNHRLEPGVNWVAIGCESGRGARWCDADWTLKAWATLPHDAAGNLDNSKLDWPVLGWTGDLVAQCRAAGVPAHVKQLPVWKAHNPKRPEHLSWGVSNDPKDFPADLRVQERPEKGEAT